MSRMYYMPNQIMCVTCQYWDGPRKIVVDKKVEVEANPKGVCTNPKCVHRGHEQLASYQCLRTVYEKWNQL